ncbi:MBL fold metallo-hydrolase [Streptacidiphilus sp. PB12-B1b]|uniref:ComEC/Rec2 family competence protein n=1 Tax=Streptacidiphilus sp. PB12-B1b TaxID=2705012 RepID=UPI0015F78F42|nr:ComEC/Rec2 family competence protein [Streptacidiphilus sp. PB12-B1b]QMU75565.1 MBL fold metallo-hydrolase [Streptacidiphilus sp. PB12-B1b]
MQQQSTAAETEAQRPPQDIRLVGPALAAWGAAAAVLGAGERAGPWALSAAALALLAAVSLLLADHHRRAHPSRARPRLLRPLAGLLLSAAAAASSAVLATADLHQGPVPGLARRQATVAVRLTVTGDPHEGNSGTTRNYVVLPATINQVTPDSAGAPRSGPVVTRTPVTVVARGPGAERWLRLLPSTRLATRARLEAADADGDTAAVLFTRGPPQVLAGPSLVQRVAGALRAGLSRACDPLAPDPRALLPGLVDGDSSRVPPDLDQAFLVTDLAHITAVSGANLSVLLVLLLGAAARSRTPERGGIAVRLGLPLRCAALLGGALTVGFVVLCRPDPSVLRAAATGLIVLLALATGRRASPLAALAGATLLLMVLDPWLARSFGFALSAVATAGLLTLGPRWSRALVRHGWPHRAAEAVACAAAAQACCGPLLVLKAAQVSLVAIPCNLLAEAAVAPATLLGFAALAAAPVSMGAATLLARLAGVPTAWIAWLARRGAEIPGAEISWPDGWPGALLLTAVTCAVVLCLPVLRYRLAAVGLALLLLGVLLRPAPVTRLVTGWPPPHWRVVACDVGQGDAFVVSPGTDPATALVIDTGPEPRAVDHCLRQLGITRIPLLLLTHEHADHVEGLPGVLDGRRVGAIETTTDADPQGETARVRRWAAAAKVPLVQAVPGERRSLGELSWQVLWPDGPLGPATPGPNNASVALLITTPTLRMAFLGDLEPPAQSRLLEHLAAYPGLRHVDVLKVAHHGSAKQDADLVRALAPRLALISCGLGNSYGHPARSTLELLRSVGSTVLRTDTQGELAVTDEGGRLAAATDPR